MRRAILNLTVCLALSSVFTSPNAETVIGMANPLSGPYAESGARNLIAVMTAVDHINENGGVLGEQVRVVTADDKCGLLEAVNAAEKLVSQGVTMVVGHLCSHSSLLAAAIYDISDVIMITPDSTHPRLTEEDRPNVFRLIGRDDDQGATAADLMAARWPERRIAILHDGSTYGQGLATETRRGLQRHGIGGTLFEQYESNLDDYSGLVAQLGGAGVELLYVGGYGPDAGRIIRAARQAGLDLQMIGGDGLGMNEFWAAAGDAGDGTIYSSFRMPSHAALMRSESATRPDVLQQFEAGGVGAYAAVELWAEAVARAESLEPKEVLGMLHRGRFDTSRGTVSFDEKGDLEDAAWTWRVWRGGKKLPLE